MFEGNYVCTCHYRSGIEGVKESYVDKVYTVSLDLESINATEMSANGSVNAILTCSKTGYLMEKDKLYHSWTGAFYAQNSFKINKGSTYWGHFTYQKLDCKK